MGQQEALNRIKADIDGHGICLFMKGTPEQPMCGFSAHVVQILNSYGLPFHAVDVLQDWDLREGIKAYTNWPTIPQLYVKGKFIGGADITAELHRKGELSGILKEAQ